VIDATQYVGAITAAQGGVTIGGQRVPLEDVGVLLLGNRASISGGALSLLARYDVVVLNCDWRGVPDLVGYAWSANSRVAARHRAQADLSQPRRKAAWQAIVKAKILGQQRNLEVAGLHAEARRLGVLRREVRSGDPSNCEAQAARVYWSAVLGDPEFRRVPGADDRVNALLNYGYTVLRGFVIQAVSAAGLWPTYGIWHRNRSNSFALADDLIEPFRPAVDHCVVTLGPHATLDERDVKRRLVAVTSVPMGSSGTTVASAIYDFASAFALYAEGEKDVLDAPSWSPPPNSLDASFPYLDVGEGEDG